MKSKWLIAGLAFLILGAGAASAYYLTREKQSDVSIAAEKRFIEMMIPHHEGALVMAKQANEQAERPETKALAASIISSQQKEIDDMRRWYKDWFGSDVPKVETDPHAGHGGEPPAGTASTFDLAFIAMMIPHHESAVSMANDIKPNAFHKEIKELAGAVIKSQSAEIEQMKKYQSEWQSGASTNNSGGETINYTDAGFDRPNIIVANGSSVTWVSKRKDPQRPTWVASDIHPEHTIYPEFDQGRTLGYEPLPKDKTYTFKFEKTGRWEYHDHYDPDKKGVVTVQ